MSIKYFFRGRDISKLSTEELLQALIDLYEQTQAQRAESIRTREELLQLLDRPTGYWTRLWNALLGRRV